MRWIWIDRFVEFEPGKRAVAVKNISLAEEHLHDHWEAFPIMPASLMVEGMAQTAGILVGQAGDQLRYEAEIQTIAPEAAATSGTIYRNGEPFGRVDLMFSHIDQNLQGLEFPKENFVFTGQFQRLVAPFVENADG